MGVPVICTIVAKNYLAQARSLVESFLEHHPDGHAFVLLVDRPDGYYDPEAEPFTTVLAEELGIPGFTVMTFRYTILELNTAVKPFFLEYLFTHYDYDKICYFDPDIYFYQPVNEIWEELDQYHIVLTPHLLGPLDDEFRPNELSILQSGTYNLGFIGLSRNPELYEFLHWWQAKLAKYCVVAIDKGLFVDQKWIDLVPGRFSRVYINRDPGCNVAYWNLYHREVTAQDHGFRVNDSPLKFFHFSGYSPDHPDVISKHQNRYTFRDLPSVKPLFEGYRQRLYANGYETVKRWPYSYDSKSRSGVRIPDMARALWRDLEFDDPFWEPFEAMSDDQFLNSLLKWLNEPVGNASTKPVITRLALAVYRQLPSVQRAFPDVLGHDRVEYVRWFVNWGRYEARIDDFFVKPIESSLEQYFKSRTRLQGMGARFYQSFTNWLFRIGVGRRIERLLGASFISKVRGLFIKQAPNKPIVPQPLPALGTPPVESGDTLGVNVVGYLCDETGVGESARATMRALEDQEFPLAWTMVKSSGARQEDRSVLHLPQGHPYDVNLLYVNADQTLVVHEELGAGFFAGKYNIGYWAWELERFPDVWMDRFQYLDEIWVGSRFVQNTLAHISPVPVVIMGVGMDRQVLPETPRDVLDLPKDKFVFLFTFDMLSFLERKNPYGVIEAYRRAFGSASRDTTLVIKATKLERSPKDQAALREAVRSVSGVLIDGYLSRPELDALFNRCDAYVSLHRSEGFGMTIAEAMSLGKPVIATDYSGNTDYMNISNSYPVSYTLIELDQDYGPYKRGSIWADPDLDHAAAQMRHVVEHYDEARYKGAQAADDLSRWYGRDAMGRKVVERLKRIASFRKQD